MRSTWYHKKYSTGIMLGTYHTAGVMQCFTSVAVVL